jgi:hypothetical protein
LIPFLNVPLPIHNRPLDLLEQHHLDLMRGSVTMHATYSSYLRASRRADQTVTTKRKESEPQRFETLNRSLSLDLFNDLGGRTGNAEHRADAEPMGKSERKDKAEDHKDQAPSGGSGKQKGDDGGDQKTSNGQERASLVFIDKTTGVQTEGEQFDVDRIQPGTEEKKDENVKKPQENQDAGGSKKEETGGGAKRIRTVGVTKKITADQQQKPAVIRWRSAARSPWRAPLSGNCRLRVHLISARSSLAVLLHHVP